MKGWQRLFSWGFLLQLLLAVGTAVAATDPPLPADDTHEQYDPSVLDSVLAYVTTDNETYVKDLFDLVAIPSISALPDHANDVLTTAGWLKLRMVSAGLENVQVLHTEGAQPVVYGDWLHAGPSKPTVLVYGHYDVQPVDPLELWESPPFEPQERDGYFYGRGVDDDKMGCLQALHAVEAFLTVASALPINMKFLYEGQEEVGSPNLPSFLTSHAEGLLSGVDLVLNADGGQPGATTPGICTGLRGAAALEVTVETAAADMHSGMKGGSVQNANHALIQLLAGLYDRGPGQNEDMPTTLLAKLMGKGSHRVAVPGFYDQVRPMSASDRADVDAFPFDDKEEQQALGVLGFMGEKGYNTLERRWYRPTLEIVGMWGGFTGEGMKTVIPRTASAKISLRLVPDMTPEYVTGKVKAHLEAAAPPHTNVTVKVLGFKANPWVSPKDTLGNQLSAKVLKKVFNKAPVFYRDGGTIPALAYFQSILGVDTTGFGFGLGDHIHAPNERTPVAQYHIGRTAYVEMLAELGQSWPADAIKNRGSRRKKPSGSAGSKPSSSSKPRSRSSSKPAAGDDFDDEYADAYDSTDSKQEL